MTSLLTIFLGYGLITKLSASFPYLLSRKSRGDAALWNLSADGNGIQSSDGEADVLMETRDGVIRIFRVVKKVPLN